MADLVALPGHVQAGQFRGDIESFIVISEWVHANGGRSTYFPEIPRMGILHRLRMLHLEKWDWVLYREGQFFKMNEKDFIMTYEEDI